LHALLIFLAGCGGSGDPELKFREIRSWMLPPDGVTLPAPRALAIGHKDELLVVDTAGRILIYDAKGELLHWWRMPDTTAGRPEGICVLKDGRIAVADTHYHRVVFFDQQGKLLSTLGSEGKGPGQFIYPVALAQDDKGDLYVAEYGGNDRVQKFGPDGTFIRGFGGFGTGEFEFQRPSGIAWRHGGIFVADAFNNRVLFFFDGTGYGVGGNGVPRSCVLRFPYGIGLHAKADTELLYITEYGAGRLTAIKVGPFRSDEEEQAHRFGSSGRGEGQFLTPWGVAVDSKGRVFVADTGNRRVVRLTP
jgi:DNA-binding beta-propeller fold protein YncE